MADYPAFATVREWIDISGVGRSKTYELLAEGKLQARKLGTRTLVDVPHGLAFLRSLPPLHLPNHVTDFRPPKNVLARS